MKRKCRVLVTKIGMDGHDLGAKTVAKILSDGGIEVIYLGKFQTPESIVNAAVAEDVDVIGISALSPNYITLIPMVIDLLKERNVSNLKVILGGVVPEPFASRILEHGVSRIFGPHSTSEDIKKFIVGLTKGSDTI